MFLQYKNAQLHSVEVHGLGFDCMGSVPVRVRVGVGNNKITRLTRYFVRAGF